MAPRRSRGNRRPLIPPPLPPPPAVPPECKAKSLGDVEIMRLVSAVDRLTIEMARYREFSKERQVLRCPICDTEVLRRNFAEHTERCGA